MINDYPRVSVIIPVFNDRQRLEICLDALEKQTYPKEYYDVVVIDNASTDDIKSTVQRFNQVQLCYEERPGSYAARNKGLSIASGEVVAFTDSDCIPASNWIEAGVSTLKKIPDCGLVGGAIDLFYINPERLTGVEIYERLKGFPQKKYIDEQKFGATANVFTYRAVLDDVGYFNADLKSGGDSEWGKRVASAGYKLHYAEDVKVLHPARSTYKELYKKCVRVMGGLPYIRNPEPKSLLMIFWRLIAGIIPPISTMRESLSEIGDANMEEKIKLATVIMFIHYIWVFERARWHVKSRRFTYF